jgi:hypothetical protein
MTFDYHSSDGKNEHRENITEESVYTKFWWVIRERAETKTGESSSSVQLASKTRSYTSEKWWDLILRRLTDRGVANGVTDGVSHLSFIWLLFLKEFFRSSQITKPLYSLIQSIKYLCFVCNNYSVLSSSLAPLNTISIVIPLHLQVFISCLRRWFIPLSRKVERMKGLFCDDYDDAEKNEMSVFFGCNILRETFVLSLSKGCLLTSHSRVSIERLLKSLFLLISQEMKHSCHDSWEDCCCCFSLILRMICFVPPFVIFILFDQSRKKCRLDTLWLSSMRKEKL